MKKILFLFIFSMVSTSAYSQEENQSFNRKLETVFQQKSKQTMGRQIIFGTIEVANVHFLNYFITENPNKSTVVKSSAKKSIKILVRGAQTFLILDIAARLYVLEILDNNDPGFVPTREILCTGLNCSQEIENALNMNTQTGM